MLSQAFPISFAREKNEATVVTADGIPCLSQLDSSNVSVTETVMPFLLII